MFKITNLTNSNFLFLIIIGLLVYILFFKSASPLPVQPGPTIVIQSDTTTTNHSGILQTQPVMVQTIPYPVEKLTKEFIPNPNYDSLKAQFQKVVDSLLALNIQKSTLTLPDSLGRVSTTDSVQGNKIIGRKWDYDIKERIINTVKTITQPAKQKTQLYWGGGLSSSLQYEIRQVEVGLQLKNKRNDLYGLKGQYQFPGGFQIGVSLYHKF